MARRFNRQHWALKTLADLTGEVRSMRTHPAFLRMGAAVVILERIVTTARSRGLRLLSLETGSGPAFEPALAMYRNSGFVNGDAFSDYQQNGFSQFLHLRL
jgi:putative acetyltransferase